MEGVENLPSDCLQLIFSYLSDSDSKAASSVCKEFLTNVNLSKQSLNVIHPKASMLSAHLKRFTQIRKIDLTNFDSDINEVILEIVRSEIDLEALDISSEKAIRIETLTKLASKMKNLKVLNFHYIDYFQRDDYLVIANSFPNLEELTIGYSYPVGRSSTEEVAFGYGYNAYSSQFSIDDGVEFLASKLKLLKKISLSGNHIISDQSLVTLSLSCVFLKDVTIQCYNSSVTENGIGLLLRNRPNLEALSVGYVEIPSPSTITIENSIGHAKALTSLEFISMKLSDKLLKEIAKAKLQLKKLGLNYCYNFTVTSLLMVLGNSQLIELHIIDSIADNQDLNLLLNGVVSKLTHIEISLRQLTKAKLLLLAAKCPSLEHIRIITSYRDRHEQLLYNQIFRDRIFHDQLPQGLHDQRLHDQRLHEQVLDEQVLDDLGFLFPNLRVLDLSLCLRPITSRGIKAILKSCKFLRKLILRRLIEEFTEVDDSELPELNLEELELISSRIDDEWFARIAKICPRLVSLYVTNWFKLKTESLKQIVKNITTLNCLYIRYNDSINVGDLLDWMVSTGNFASLRRIYVGKNFRFSEKQRDEFLQHDCLLLHW